MSKNNAHKKKHKTVFVILLILGILIFLFGITGLFAAPPFGIAFMVVGAAITIPFFVSGGKQKPVTVAKNESDVFNFENISIDEVVSKSVEAGRKGGLAKQANLANARSAKQSLANLSDPINTSLEENTHQYKTENHHVTGTSYRQKEIESLGEENPIYEYSKRELIDEEYEGEKVYYYDFNPSTVELIEEPDNKFDPNAVKVVIDSVFVGYIKKGSCTHVKNLLKSGRIAKIDAEIHGGKYKLLYSEYDEDKDKEVYEVETGESNYYVTVEIKYLL